MPGLVAAVCLAALIALTIAWTAESHHRPGGVELRNGCHRLYPAERFYRYAVRHYRVRASLTWGQKHYILRMVRCQRTLRGQRWARAKRKLYIHRRTVRLAHYRLVPYGPCFGGRWSVPCYVIGCESHGHWGAYNPSGAAGPYQLMGMHGRPFPVRSWRDRMAHHRIASNLWDGGNGASAWVCA